MNSQKFTEKFGEPIDFYGYKAYKYGNCYYIKSLPIRNIENQYDTKLYFCPTGKKSGSHTINYGRGVQCAISKELYENSDIEVMQEIVPVFKDGKLAVDIEPNATIFSTHKRYKTKFSSNIGTTTFLPEFVNIIDDRLLISERTTTELDPTTRQELVDIKFKDTLLVGKMEFTGDKIINYTNRDAYTGKYQKTEYSLDKIYEGMEKRSELNIKLMYDNSCVSKLKNDYEIYNIYQTKMNSADVQKSE